MTPQEEDAYAAEVTLLANILHKSMPDGTTTAKACAALAVLLATGIREVPVEEEREEIKSVAMGIIDDILSGKINVRLVRSN